MCRWFVPVWLLLASLLSPSAQACSYPNPPSLKEAISKARSAFVFRLEQATYKPVPSGPDIVIPAVEGKIVRVQHLYGPPTTFSGIRYSPHWCGGAKLVVGRHYLIVTGSAGGVIQIAPADRSILDLEGGFNPKDLKRNLKSPVILPVIQALYRTKPLPDQFPPQWLADRVTVGPPPPPPPPPSGSR